MLIELGTNNAVTQNSKYEVEQRKNYCIYEPVTTIYRTPGTTDKPTIHYNTVESAVGKCCATSAKRMYVPAKCVDAVRCHAVRERDNHTPTNKIQKY